MLSVVSCSECDTIPGRQCMASCFFLLKNFEDVNIYLNSIKTYMYGSAHTYAAERGAGRPRCVRGLLYEKVY